MMMNNDFNILKTALSYKLNLLGGSSMLEMEKNYIMPSGPVNI
jgi:hypothetical protein